MGVPKIINSSKTALSCTSKEMTRECERVYGLFYPTPPSEEYRPLNEATNAGQRLVQPVARAESDVSEGLGLY